jgi:exodeoxyribonuclease VII small subunit
MRASLTRRSVFRAAIRRNRIVYIDRGTPIALFLQFAKRVAMTKPAKHPQSFEAALAELEQIVAAMEDGQLPLEQSLAAYKRGAELLQFCQRALQDVQQQVRVLESGALQNFAANGEE